MIEVFPGKGPASRPLSTGYLINRKVAIDSPEGVSYPNTELIILTHEHCDHLAGLASNPFPAACSPEAAKAIRSGRTFCPELGLPDPQIQGLRILQDNEALRFPDFTLRILHTPGHCPGAICVYLEEKKYLFSGDTVFGGLMLPNLSLPGSEPHALLHSYERLSKLEIEKIFPGHGEHFSSENYIEELKETLRLLLEH